MRSKGVTQWTILHWKEMWISYFTDFYWIVSMCETWIVCSAVVQQSQPNSTVLVHVGGVFNASDIWNVASPALHWKEKWMNYLLFMGKLG